MRDSCPFITDILIRLDGISVIQGVEFVVFIGEMFRRKRDPVCGVFMHHQLKFREHCLTVKGSPEHVEQIVHQIRLFCPAFCFGKQIMLEQKM